MTVEDLFDMLVPRLAGPPQCTILQAVTAVHQIIVNRLLLKRSDLTKDTVQLPVATATVTLPDDYFAPDGLPQISGEGNLFPLPAGADTSLAVFSTPGVPRWQEVKGRTMTVWPPPDVEYTVNVPAFVRPAVPATLDAALPFWGTFDNVYLEGTLAVLQEGISAVADQAFSLLISSQVDQVLVAKDMADEQAEADAINYR